ncbi:zinc/cadmium resistance protein-like protein [Trichodelitschia bisporula]|uniref:Zinc/cadmium resistance protein-like protein n=1 Tax=Trichodelitschia bisporula TaxID=703511 RepID=A0A6G1HWL6_9PEZI|nr:zinc/cadmium resistance protein-like protein [Trichodelitschia bisporula]
MGLSKTRRIQILLVIDVLFFLIEITVGYAVHSLALVADSFHMLNDVISLCVGLWAVKVAHSKAQSNSFTYGWQRAETLGALVNGVFLVALCLSIFLEAVQRFFEPQDVSHPKLVLIVGCFGLASNILGLFLFHDHGHGHSHGSPAKDKHSAAEEGHAHPDSAAGIADESGNIVDVLPQSRVAGWSSTKAPPRKRGSAEHSRTNSNSTRGLSIPHRRQKSRSRSRTYSSLDEIHVHPASFRNDIIAASRLETLDSDSASNTEAEAEVDSIENGVAGDGEPASEHTTLLPKDDGKPNDAHREHRHAKPKDKSAHGHSHGDLNMRGVFLHVMGDALGNIGVIVSALFIWKTTYSWRSYADPVVSLVITIIILCSALPLCKAASRILLQAVPAGLNIADIKADIAALPGVVAAHHLHVWQLSDTKLIASLHVRVAFEFEGEGSRQYMRLAKKIRECLHEYGIHSSTIQPEFCSDPDHAHKLVSSSNESTQCGDGAQDVEGQDGACMLDCGDECGDGGMCCAPENSEGGGPESGTMA